MFYGAVKKRWGGRGKRERQRVRERETERQKLLEEAGTTAPPSWI